MAGRDAGSMYSVLCILLFDRVSAKGIAWSICLAAAVGGFSCNHVHLLYHHTLPEVNWTAFNLLNNNALLQIVRALLLRGSLVFLFSCFVCFLDFDFFWFSSTHQLVQPYHTYLLPYVHSFMSERNIRLLRPVDSLHRVIAMMKEQAPH